MTYVSELKAHIEQLLKKHAIGFEFIGPDETWSYSFADPECNKVYIPVIRSSISYAVALHEIGHIKGRFQSSKNRITKEVRTWKIGHAKGRFLWSKNRITKEVWAWKRAEKNAMVWTPTMEKKKCECLRSYTRPWRGNNSRNV
jgi:hypothetical protein